jgi:long-chain-fatty-acid--[acyl-carrier-protein] ligase
MISLASIEEVLFENAVKRKLSIPVEGPSLAVSAKEQEGEKPRFYVFTTLPMTMEEANATLKAAGFTNLVKIAGVHKLAELPLLGTGKINYRALEAEYLTPALAK